eukprot:TRINITY_DN9921_c0_g1_i1.p3 TRINITY_DN9921_c0_g1~~TRINITY_DN9921_c0_g1_i1.p3  ORF type:complete len:104 (+),score=18.47 TRINITY_DN9921_c0_g1_i1:108-419(+)
MPSLVGSEMCIRDRTTPEQMWKKYSKVLGIDEPRFYSYYKDKNKAIGIEIGTIKSINPISLDELRKIDTTFNPPQVYRYVTNEQICKIITEYLQVQHLSLIHI